MMVSSAEATLRSWASLSRPLAPSIRQARQRDPGIILEGPAPHQAGLDEAVHHPGETARGQHHPPGKLAHPEAPLRRPGQAKQDVVGPERDAVLLPEVRVEQPHGVVVSVEQGLPRSKLRLGELGHHVTTSLPGQHLRLQALSLSDTMRYATIVGTRNPPRGEKG